MGWRSSVASAQVNYETGSQGISGTIAGPSGTLSFSQSTWRVRGSGDPSLTIAGLIGGTNPIEAIVLLPILTIGEGANVIDLQLQETPGLQWVVYSLNLTDQVPGLSVHGFSLLDLSDTLNIPAAPRVAWAIAVRSPAGTPSLYPPQLLTGIGDVAANGIPTDLGLLTVSESQRNPGVFRADPEPVPAPLSLLAMGELLRRSRILRNTHRRARGLRATPPS